MKEETHKKLIEETNKIIDGILKDGIQVSNVENLFKVVDIQKDAYKIKKIKEEESMNYGNYGTYGNYGREQYGEYGEYGARRRNYRRRYRGHDHLDRVADEYGRYSESRDRYGASEETDKSFHYMIKALEDFIVVLNEEADTPQQKMELKSALQKATI